MKEFNISSFQLKMLALVTMFIDHVGAVLCPGVMWFRIIGRLAFPIFAFLLAEGYTHTRDVRKYGTRLLLFGFISEVPFDYALTGMFPYWFHQNIFFTLFLGLLMMWLWDTFQGKPYLQIPAALACLFASEYLRLDYGWFGIMLIAIFFLFKNNDPWIKLVLAAGLFILEGSVMMYGALAMIPIFFYNGRQGPKMKYLFYVFYPAHLLVLGLLNMSYYGWMIQSWFR